jgi:hypothetical protein
MEKNCAFQYVRIKTGILGSTQIVCDKTSLTLNEAKQLWNEHYSDCAKWIHEGNEAEMVLWINMETPQSYGESLQYISTDAESDGTRIWIVKKEFFTQF